MESTLRLEHHPAGVAQRGYTLLELVIVTGLIAILAAIALPSLQPARSESLALAAQRVAEAIRFARSEALRSGEIRLVEVDKDLEQIRVATADLSGATAVPATDLIHPVSKQPYRLVLPDQAGMGGIGVTDEPFNYPSGGTQAVLLFNAQGIPFHKHSGAYKLLILGDVELTLDDQQAHVLVAPTTGRVTVQ